MPVYDYICNTCNNTFELRMPISKVNDLINCPYCVSGQLIRYYASAPAIQFKGSGFYSTGG